MKRNVYAYIVKNNSFWRGVCISAVGNLYCDKIFYSEMDAIQEVTQNIKSMLNEKHPGEDWYNLILTYNDSPEIVEAWECHEMFANPTWKDTLKYKIQIYYLICCMWVRWFMGK